MRNGFGYFVVFGLGAATGSIVAWKLLKTKYKQLAREEIDEVREYYRNKETAVDEACEPDTPEEDISNDDIQEYETLTQHYTEQKGGSEMSVVPQVITPEEFAADDEYQVESLTLYACGTLTDDLDNPIEDVEAMVGDALGHFGEYEDDAVYVRNDRYKCNYEILKDLRTFEEARRRALNLMDDDE